jgi:hypothetical protein
MLSLASFPSVLIVVDPVVVDLGTAAILGEPLVITNMAGASKGFELPPSPCSRGLLHGRHAAQRSRSDAVDNPTPRRR